MFIEDLIHTMSRGGHFYFSIGIQMAPPDEKIVLSFSSQIDKGLGLTEKQAILAQRLIKKYSSQLNVLLKTDVVPFADQPVFKLPIRTIEKSKIVKFIVTDDNKRKLAAFFPYDEEIILSIRNFKKELLDNAQLLNRSIAYDNQPAWSDTLRCWTFPIWEECLGWVNDVLVPNGFEIEKEIVNLLNDIQDIKNSIEQYVPMITFDDDKFQFQNVHHKVDQPTSTDLLETLFLAKKQGITTWDETIEKMIASNSINPITRQVLDTPLSKGFVVNPDIYTLYDLTDFIKYHNFCLFLIPGGSEILNLKYCYKFLNDIGISKEQMTVLFRLDNDKGKDFNEFVKMFQLNNPLDEKIKIVFLSGKIPKTLINYNREIDVIINLGDEAAHYTQKNLVKNHHCVINYKVRKTIANV